MDFREQLRNETMPFHRKAERASQKYGSVETTAGYTRFLQVMFFIYSQYGEALDNSSELLGLPRRNHQILEALQRDLDSVGSTVRTFGVNQKRALTQSSSALLLGVAYVFEGSALGSTVLLGKLQNCNAVECPAHNYLSLLSDNVKVRWPVTMNALKKLKVQDALVLDYTINIFENITSKMGEDHGEYQ